MPHPFIDELRALLEKHKATIQWECHWASDLHGVTDQKMVIEVDRIVVASVDGAGISAHDLKD